MTLFRPSFLGMFLALILTSACASTGASIPGPTDASPLETPPSPHETASPMPTSSATPTAEGDDLNPDIFADVISVETSGEAGAYRFSVTVASPDTGCDRYADWWEVVSERGDLIYRRVLLHSHVDEQPFERSGGTVEIAPDTPVIIRAHMNTSGYGGQVYRGTVQDGFRPASTEPGFATELEQSAPLPQDCAF